MNSTDFNNFFFNKKNYFLINNMITKINTHKIKYQPNIKIFVWDYITLLKNKPKQIINTNSKLT
jgi:hypothetical protein